MSKQRTLDIPRPIRPPSPEGLSRVFVRSDLPSPEDLGLDSVVLYDRRLPSVDAAFRSWIQSFPASVGLRAGEALKDVAGFSPAVTAILRRIDSIPGARARRVVAVGGGSVGDFAGFFASVYHRGVPLIHVPSTWLAALDSSHGGKTALNVREAKNQLGTFHSAERVYIVERLLLSQPEARAREAMGELIKAALIDGGRWVGDLERSKLDGGALLWKFLPDAILAKYAVVRRDPFEKSGVRAVLNLGHTLGHVLELRHQLPHGTAVAYGLHFAVDWSLREKTLSAAKSAAVRRLLDRHLALEEIGPRRRPPPIRRGIFLRLAMQDKKKSPAGGVKFIFLRGIGEPVARDVSLEAFFSVAKEAGWAE